MYAAYQNATAADATSHENGTADNKDDAWLITILSSDAPLDGKHLRKRRSEQCFDHHPSCGYYREHCTNDQFQATCPVTCGDCPFDPELEIHAEPEYTLVIHPEPDSQGNFH